MLAGRGEHSGHAVLIKKSITPMEIAQSVDGRQFFTSKLE